MPIVNQQYATIQTFSYIQIHICDSIHFLHYSQTLTHITEIYVTEPFSAFAELVFMCNEPTQPTQPTQPKQNKKMRREKKECKRSGHMFVWQTQNVRRHGDETTQNKWDQKKYEAKTTTKIYLYIFVNVQSAATATCCIYCRTQCDHWMEWWMNLSLDKQILYPQLYTYSVVCIYALNWWHVLFSFWSNSNSKQQCTTNDNNLRSSSFRMAFVCLTLNAINSEMNKCEKRING